MRSIGRAVGQGGTNDTDDVFTVQYLLNCVPEAAGGPRPELAVDGICGPHTISAIWTFQLAQTGRTDGRVDPGGRSINLLNGFDPLPDSPLLSTAASKSVAKGGGGGKAGGAKSRGAGGGTGGKGAFGKSGKSGKSSGKAAKGSGKAHMDGRELEHVGSQRFKKFPAVKKAT